MESPFELILLLLALLSGAVGVFFAYTLMQKYRLPYTGTYFYFLVFLYIFGAYSLAGSGLLENLMFRMEADPASIQTARIFSILAGMPLLALAYFMWMRTTAYLLAKKVWKVLAASYLVLAFVAIITYGYFALRLTWFEKGTYLLLFNIQWWVFAALQACIFICSALVLFLGSRRQVEHERSFSRIFGILYLAYGILGALTHVLGGMHTLLPFLFLFIFLAWHLVPILFLNNYLARYHGETTTLEKNFENSLDEFVERHEISKREREVIVLISKGLSNQQISEALFISLQTVKDHVHRIFIKTGVKNRIQLTNLVRSNASEGASDRP